ncbi:MAG: hypothetical protein LUD15_11785 [Bacteroides sp.]|nr:hypothetical protein [Bacteroides sp.]
MSREEIIYIVLTCIPAYSSFICGLLILKLHNRGESSLGSGPLMWAFAAYLLSALVWLSLIFYVVLPGVYIALSPLIVLSYAGLYVVWYRFVFEVTKIDTTEEFPGVHYILPLFGFTCMLGCVFFVPFSKQMEALSNGRGIAEYQWLALLFNTLPVWILIFNFLYAILGVFRAKRYRKTVVNYSADVQRASLGWLSHILYAMLAMVPLIGWLYFISGTVLVTYSFLILVLVLVAVFKYTILVHNLLLKNFVIIKNGSGNGKSDPAQQDNFSMGADPLSRQNVLRLDAYMRKNKPYLNPKLKITDLTVPLNTNRTALSILINSSLGMNFSRYVNRYRLLELRKLRSNPANKSLTELKLVAKAGFSDYRGY